MKRQPAARLLVSKHRLEALIDGIFAVALTLLVIEIKLPEPAVVASHGMVHAVAQQFPTFLAWMISFLVLGIFWSAQQRLFHFVRSVDEQLTWLTIAYLSLVSLLAVGITAVRPGFGSMAFILMMPITRLSRRIERAQS